MTADPLIAAATEARMRGVRAVLAFPGRRGVEADDGTIIPGCNVESASYGLTICAERVAIFAGVARRLPRFPRVAVVTDTDTRRRRAGRAGNCSGSSPRTPRCVLANLDG